MGKNGGWGSLESKKDEETSVEVMNEIFEYICNNYSINGYRFKYIDKISEKLVYKRNNIKFNEKIKTHYIIPDGGIILLVNNENENDFHLLLSCENKSQKTKGNACERYSKNFNFFWNHFTKTIDINPYVIFFNGSFVKEDGSFDDFLLSKLRISLPNNDIIWDNELPHTSFKQRWNRIYLKREEFTKEEKKDILYKVLENSINYYSEILKK